MSPEELVDFIRRQVVDSTNSAYAEILESYSTSQAEDKYWKQVLALYAELDESGKALIKQIMKQVSVDTVSGILAILDGITLLDPYRGDFSLKYDDGPRLNGELQDIFLAEYDT